MAYTIGARHVLTGSGQVAISAPVGLRISIANVPRGISEQFGAVPTYATLGHLTLGNSDGWRPAINLRHTSQLEYPLPDSLTVLGYDLVAGATATVDELVAVAVPGPLPMPWDRNPISGGAASFNAYTGPSSGTLWTYTVPAGRRFVVQMLSVESVRTGLSGTAGLLSVLVIWNGVGIVTLRSTLNVLGERITENMPISSWVLSPGDIVRATYSLTDIGGYYEVQTTMMGMLFDA